MNREQRRKAMKRNAELAPIALEKFARINVVLDDITPFERYQVLTAMCLGAIHDMYHGDKAMMLEHIRRDNEERLRTVRDRGETPAADGILLIDEFMAELDAMKATIN